MELLAHVRGFSVRKRGGNKLKCELCGRDTPVRHFYPGIATVTHRFNHGSWVCDFCLYVSWYQSQGFSFFPLKPRSKEPAVPSWKPYQERKPTLEEVSSWLRGGVEGIAVVCGSVSDNLVVMDFDDCSVYEKAFSKHRELERSTFVVKTSRGIHVYVKSAVPPGPTEKYDNLKFEYRAERSYVVAPPSIHPAGVQYKLIGVFNVLTVADAKEEKEAILKRLGYKPLEFPPSTFRERKPLKYVPPCVQRLKGVKEGFRNEAAIRLVSFMRWELELPEDEVWKRLVWWNQFNQPPLDHRELQKVFRSALKGGYRYGCSSMKEYCVPGLCRIARSKLLQQGVAEVKACSTRLQPSNP